ncbi:MAG: hypothetical protein IT285_04035, partial [Bdellovibrionales bacterium]|nr:hypothetical protein [Bdellovibrionales bacterium]
LFRLHGRGDDVLRIGYDSVDYGFVQEAVLAVQGLSGTVQMRKRREEGRDRLEIRVETELPNGIRPDAARALELVMLEKRPSLRSFVEKGTVWPLRIDLVDPGTLPRNPRTGKLIRVEDSL